MSQFLEFLQFSSILDIWKDSYAVFNRKGEGNGWL